MPIQLRSCIFLPVLASKNFGEQGHCRGAGMPDCVRSTEPILSSAKQINVHSRSTAPGQSWSGCVMGKCGFRGCPCSLPDLTSQISGRPPHESIVHTGPRTVFLNRLADLASESDAGGRNTFGCRHKNSSRRCSPPCHFNACTEYGVQVTP